MLCDGALPPTMKDENTKVVTVSPASSGLEMRLTRAFNRTLFANYMEPRFHFVPWCPFNITAKRMTRNTQHALLLFVIT